MKVHDGDVLFFVVSGQKLDKDEEEAQNAIPTGDCLTSKRCLYDRTNDRYPGLVIDIASVVDERGSLLLFFDFIQL